MARMRPIVYPKWICKATVPMNIIYIYHYISVFIHLVICACMHASICTYKLLRFLNTYYVYIIYIYLNLWATVNISHIAPNHQFLKSVLSIVFQVWGI
jgi:hypothetical protein